MSGTTLPRIRLLAAVAALAGALVAPAHAQRLSASGGFDYYSGPGGQITRTLEASGLAEIGGGSVSLTGSRFDDSVVGRGTGVGAGLAFPIAPIVQLSLAGARYVGDDTFRGWRLKGGPQFRLGSGQTLGLYAAHYDDNANSASSSVSLDLGVPVGAALSLRGSAGYASGLGVSGPQGTVGLTWRTARFLELSGDVGRLQSGLGVAGAFPAKHARNLAQPAQGVAELGVRFVFP